MAFTVRDFSDLLDIVNSNPTWRRKMVKALFPEINVQKAFQDLAETGRRLEATIARMDARTAEAKAERKQLGTRMESGFAEAKAEYRTGFAEAERKREAGFAEVKAEYRAGFAEAKKERTEIRKDVAELKGVTHEDFYFKKADAVFGRYLKNGQNATAWVADRLYEAQRTELINGNELTQVLASDLLWRGKLRTTGDEVILVLEASWFIEAHDIERAAKRAGILRRLGINAIPVAAGREWTEAMRQLAKSHRVVMTDNGKVNDESWQSALEA